MLEKKLRSQILVVSKALEKYSVEYIVVGGTALAFHGHYRMTRLDSGELSNKHDFDIWYNPSYENYFNLLNSLSELGIDISKYVNDIAPNPKKSFFKYEFDNYELDLLPEIFGLEKFYDSYFNCEDFIIDRVVIKVLSLEHLITSKKSLGREKDVSDIRELESLIKLDAQKNK